MATNLRLSMVTLRCTKKLCKYLDVNPANNIELPTTELGDWYGNLVPTSSGDLILFISERSLLTVAIPVWESDNLVPLFRLRIANLLGLIGVNPKIIANELRHYNQVNYGKTASRRILGSLNDFTWHYQFKAEKAKGKSDLSLSNVELEMSQMPCKPIDYRSPSEVAIELLSNS
jgi:hypothetical protein